MVTFQLNTPTILPRTTSLLGRQSFSLNLDLFLWFIADLKLNWNDQFQFEFLRRSEIKAEVGGYSGSLSDLGWNYQTPRTPLKPPDGNIGPHCNEWAGNAMHCATSSQALQWAVDKNAMQCISLQCTSLKYTVHEMHCSRHWSRLFCFALHFDSSTLWHL